MTQIQAVNFGSNANYNAVKIRINNPQATVPEGLVNVGDSEYNAVNIEVNNPELKAEKEIYRYPDACGIVTYDNAGITPVVIPDLPVVPVAYETSIIESKTYINDDSEEKADVTDSEAPMPESSEPVIIELSEITAVPVPNVTTPEAEKVTNTALNFHGINFKAAKPEILPDGDLKAQIDINKVTANLKSDDYMTVMHQMKEIALTSAEKPQDAVPYYTPAVFSSLIDIVNKDNSNLERPTEEQNEIREKIILNSMAREQQMREGKTEEQIELPYQVTAEEAEMAVKLSPKELSDRTKEGAVYTLATLAKAYGEEFEKQTGNIVPITDMPGISDIVGVLKSSDNINLKLTAMDSLMYIRRPEYNNELKAVFEVMANDNNRMLAEFASLALNELNK